jgi:carbon-monoxide dehydrogenase medium subunit
LQPFEFFEPSTVEEVVELVDGKKSMVLAGGVDLILKMRRRFLLPEKVVSLQKVPGLDYVEGNGSGLKFGALTTLRQIEQAQVVKERFSLLNEAISKIVSVQTKTMGTAVGNLCAATPASDVAPPLYVMGAQVKITGESSKRELPIEDFFVAVGQTALKPHEIVTEINMPGLSSGTGTAFLKLSKTAEDIAKVNVAVMVTLADGKCSNAKIALGSVAPTPIRAGKAEEVMKGEVVDKAVLDEAAEAAAEAASPISDVRSTAEYRKEMVRVLVKDALEMAVARAQA